jgi:enoyl-CoA hydratase/carnithine racemase
MALRFDARHSKFEKRVFAKNEDVEAGGNGSDQHNGTVRKKACDPDPTGAAYICRTLSLSSEMIALWRVKVEYNTIIYDVRDKIATITLDRPQHYNSFDAEMVDEFADVWRRVRDDDDIRVIVLQAAPCPAFSTGADISRGPNSKPFRKPEARSKPWQMIDPGEYLGPKSNRVWKPMIVAVSGMCAGGAFYWLNEADIIICSEDATFFDPHVTFGKVSACEPIGALARMPLSEIQRMVLLGNHERISAQTALRISLVTEVLPRDRLWGRATELAGFIADKHPVAIEGSVRAIWEALSLPHRAAVENALKYVQIGNPISAADGYASSLGKVPFHLR